MPEVLRDGHIRGPRESLVSNRVDTSSPDIHTELREHKCLSVGGVDEPNISFLTGRDMPLCGDQALVSGEQYIGFVGSLVQIYMQGICLQVLYLCSSWS